MGKSEDSVKTKCPLRRTKFVTLTSCSIAFPTSPNSSRISNHLQSCVPKVPNTPDFLKESEEVLTIGILLIILD